MIKKRNIILAAVIFCMLVCSVGCNNGGDSSEKNNSTENSTADNGADAPATNYPSADGMSSYNYFFSKDGIGYTDERFMSSEWDEAGYQYLCTDFTCDHKTEVCSALIPVPDANTSYSEAVYFEREDKIVIFSSYKVAVFGERADKKWDDADYYYTDIYEADLDGSNRKLIKTIEAEFKQNNSYLMIGDKVIFGGMKSEISVLDSFGGMKTAENTKYDNAVFCIDLNDYSVKEYEVDNSKYYGSYYTSEYDGYVYLVMRSPQVGGTDENGNDTIIDDIDEKWYRIDIYEDTCELIHEFTDTQVAFNGVIDNVMYYSYYGDVLYSKEIGKDTVEQEFMTVESDADLLVANIYEDRLIIMTECEIMDGEYHIKYTWYDSDKNEIKSHEYDEWIVFNIFLDDKIIYMKPFTKGVEQYWIDMEDVADLEDGGTYLGNLSGSDVDTIE